jgi:hypothetical protein
MDSESVIRRFPVYREVREDALIDLNRKPATIAAPPLTASSQVTNDQEKLLSDGPLPVDGALKSCATASSGDMGGCGGGNADGGDEVGCASVGAAAAVAVGVGVSR